MLFRFCLYGFLKNQRYFEPFLFLALLDKGLSFLSIGTLVAVREITVHLLEIPSGAAADLFGRRRAMVLAFAAYLGSFATFGYAEGFPALCGAMALFGVGEAFRSGSHKAMIFTWLELQGRADEKTAVYGLTRSWSKFGSALSALVAALLVFLAADYQSIFFWSMLPCALSIANLCTYPAAIDPLPATPATLGSIARHLGSILRDAVRRPALRRLMVESMGFNGTFLTAKDYLQPVVMGAALVWLGGGPGSGDGLADSQRTALLLGPVYFVLFLAAGIASRNAHRFVQRAGGDEAGARALWTLLALVCAAIAAGDGAGIAAVTIAAFASLHVLQNLWRPVMTSRIHAQVDKAQGATVLSVESQAHRLVAAVLAPTFGWLVDLTGAFWPIGALIAALALGMRTWRQAAGA